MCDVVDTVWGDGTIGMLALGAIALLLWAPAWAAVFYTAPRTQNFLRDRNASDWVSRGAAGVVSGVLLLVWLPAYVITILLVLDGWEAAVGHC
jgi:threonine/homoserine/homoserine lactone efflux protein